MSLFADLTTSVNAVRPNRTNMRNYDPLLMIAVITLVSVGLLMVYSASIALADGPHFANYGRYYFVARHAAFVVIGFLAAALVYTVPIGAWQKITIAIFIACLILLLLVLIVGKEVNHAVRWLAFGPINFQPSELMKVAALLYAADYTVRKQEYMQNIWRGFIPMACALLAVAGLLLLEPDLGALMVIVSIAIGILFLGGINARIFIALAALLPLVFALLIWLAPWRRARIFAYLDPWNPATTLSSGYQLSHSLIAIGRGQWFGVGLGSSVEKLHYLPEAHTDFIMAVIGEELGFAGVAAMIFLFAIVVQRCFEIGRQAIAMDRVFNGLVAQGVGIWIAVQTFINIGVCLGLLPTKGLTLPLVSYGGSGIVMNLCALALVARIDFENRMLMRGGRG